MAIATQQRNRKIVYLPYLLYVNKCDKLREIRSSIAFLQKTIYEFEIEVKAILLVLWLGHALAKF